MYKIDVQSGKVLARYNLWELARRQKELVRDRRVAHYDRANNVLNGIAYNKARKSYFVTGKRWFQIYEVIFNQ